MPFETFAAPSSQLPAIMQRNSTINQRRPAAILPAMREMAEMTTVYIFNVGPWAQKVIRGSWRFDIPACPEGKALSEPISIPGMVFEEYPQDEKSMRLLTYDGLTHALDLIGVGPMLNPSQALTHRGVFVSKSNPPKAEEIAEAKRLVFARANVLVTEADVAYSQGAAVAHKVIQPAFHHVAARMLKKTVAECPWLGQTVAVSDRIPCIFCGEPMLAHLPTCPNCKQIVDQAKFDAAVAKANGTSVSTKKSEK